MVDALLRPPEPPSAVFAIATRISLQPRVEGIGQAIPQEVDAQHRQTYGQAGKDYLTPCLEHVFVAGVE